MSDVARREATSSLGSWECAKRVKDFVTTNRATLAFVKRRSHPTKAGELALVERGLVQARSSASRASGRAIAIAFALVLVITAACLIVSVLLLGEADSSILFGLSLSAGSLGGSVPALARTALLLGRRRSSANPDLPWIAYAALLTSPLVGFAAGLAVRLLPSTMFSALSASSSRLFFAVFAAGLAAGVLLRPRIVVAATKAPVREAT
jgi:hypothetical protein